MLQQYCSCRPSLLMIKYIGVLQWVSDKEHIKIGSVTWHMKIRGQRPDVIDRCLTPSDSLTLPRLKNFPGTLTLPRKNVNKPEIKPESGPRQDFNPVSHHWHFVQSGLTIEDDNIIISDVPFHSVSKLQMKVTWFGVKPQINPLSIVPDDILGTWILVVASTYKFLHAIDNADKQTIRFNPFNHIAKYLLKLTLC